MILLKKSMPSYLNDLNLCSGVYVAPQIEIIELTIEGAILQNSPQDGQIPNYPDDGSI